MALAHGTRLGPYEIQTAIGAGGMGEVYRARDTRLDRDVAIKILPEGFAADAVARERFQREAKSIAALNHPHICTLHDIGEEGETSFLVMELVEGETLAATIASRPIPLASALLIAGQIADALDKAHRAGIAHRDLKPANVMLTKDGGSLHVKLLDFGLAKPAGLRGQSSATGVAALTMTASPTLTAAGSIVGTLHYMAPEQLEGKDADPRSDIWAFGCVLYEMLTGARPFDAKSSVGLMAAILEHEPAPMAVRQPLTPPALEHLISRCLVKDPEARWQSARDLAIELTWIADAGAGSGPALASPPPTSRRVLRWAATVGVAMAAAVFGAAAGARWLASPATSDNALVTFDIDAPSAALESIAASPDGNFIVYAGTSEGVTRLMLREIASTTERVLPGTEGATYPFWSPDSRSVGFSTRGELKRVDLAGAAAIRIAQLPLGNIPALASWGEGGRILFGQNTGTGIHSVGHQGGPISQVTIRADNLDRNHLFPRFLPGGRAFVYLRVRGVSILEESEVVHRSLDTGEEHVVLKAYSQIEFAPPNWLLYTEGAGAALMAQRFDPSTGELLGDFTVLAPSILRAGPQSTRSIAVSGRLLAYRTGTYSAPKLTWFTRSGVAGPAASSVAQVDNPVLSPSGELIASNGALNSSSGSDVWLTDTRRGTVTRLTFDVAADSDAVFSPDSKAIVFYSARAPAGLYRKTVAGGADELLAPAGMATWTRDWSADGRHVLYDKGGDIWSLTLATPPTTSALISEPGAQGMGHFSPDTKRIAYTSDETGRSEVFVQNFPLSGSKWQVSSAGGSEPRWRTDGRELFYLGADGRLMAVDVGVGAEFKLGIPHALFQTRLMELPQVSLRRYSVTGNGQRFLMNVAPADDGRGRPITVVVNWQRLLDQSRKP